MTRTSRDAGDEVVSSSGRPGSAGGRHDLAAPAMRVHIRYAGPSDASAIAGLHAESWRRFYRGAYSDGYLDGDIASDRLIVWTQRLAISAPAARTILAEDETGLLGFIHLVLDEDEQWGSLIDNLHVTHRRHRTGLGTALISLAATEVIADAAGPSMYLWVQEQNSAAQRFYQAMGGIQHERALIAPPGGDQSRLTGQPHKIKIIWPDVRALPPDSAGHSPDATRPTRNSSRTLCDPSSGEPIVDLDRNG